MRTTVEISDDLRAALLARAARRGEKGFSRLVDDAIRLYLSTIPEDDANVRDLLVLGGILSDDPDAAGFRERVRTLRTEPDRPSPWLR